MQNTTITDTNRSETSDGAHLISQCYYGSAEPDKSGSLGLMQRNPKDPGTRPIRQFWHETFDHFASKKMAKKPKKSGRKTMAKMKRNTKACGRKKSKALGKHHTGWVIRWGGILYVLKNDRMLRISFGGPGSADDKLTKSKVLAQKAMSRL